MIKWSEINLFDMFNDVSLFLNFFSDIHVYANYTNKIIRISDHEIKGMCLSFYLLSIVVVYDT